MPFPIEFEGEPIYPGNWENLQTAAVFLGPHAKTTLAFAAVMSRK
jgi:hypothetical protein